MLLEIKDLNIQYDNKPAVQEFSLSLKQGQTIGIMGESGCGKTSILNSIMGILPKNSVVSGEINYGNQNLLKFSKKEYDCIRWNKIAIVFQNSVQHLNPRLTIFEQIVEVMKKDKDLTKNEKILKIEKLFKEFDLERHWLFSLPHQLSGGMLQRVFIIMALIAKPNLLLIDEPTTALEHIGRAKLIDYLIELKKKKGMTMLVVSHDLKVIEALTDKTIVMYKGNIFEKNFTSQIFTSPSHPYTRDLINASHDINPYKDLWGIQKIDNIVSKGCTYYNYCTQRIEKCKTEKPPIVYHEGVACHRGMIVDLFKAENINKIFNINKKNIIACKNCYLKLKHGEILSIIGQSGSGKTTLSKIIAGIFSADSGTIEFNQEEFSNKNRMNILNGVQIILQDPYSAVNPLFTVREAILEPLKINSIYDEEKRNKLLEKILEAVELKDVIDSNTKTKNLSGGQIQRMVIARALIMEPKLLIADEITASLDISNKVNLLRLLKELQNRKGFAMIFVTHDLRMAQKISDSIAVMYKAEIVEQNTAYKIFLHPQHNYTQRLISTI